MSLFFNISNKLTSLSDKLVRDILPGLDVFQPARIITQTKGLNNWLTMEIADKEEIAANLHFFQPADFVSAIYSLLNEKKERKISRGNIDWLIYRVLSEKEFQLRFPYQKEYYFEGDKINHIKQWELAAKVADLFDQYQVYRQETIRQWSRKKYTGEDKRFEWQYYIWNRINEIAGSSLPDMTVIHERILTALEDPQKISLLQRHFPKIALFGLSVFTRYHIHLFYALAAHIDFHFYLLNPAPEQFWEYDTTEKEILKRGSDQYLIAGNSLLTNWGKLLQGTFRMLNTDDTLINIREETGVEAPPRNSLLSKIQNDIFHNRTEDIRLYAADLYDESIRITAHYTIQSEVQTLYNYILQLTEQKKIRDLTERDILVMTTDIDAYAPYIKAVFDNAPFRFNYSIADESIASGHTVAGALLQLLEISEAGFTAEKVFELLDSRRIRNKFGIEDIPFLRHAVDQAAIRFGFENRKEDDTYLVSWKYGIQKLMYGICFAESVPYTAGNESFISMDIADSAYAMQQVIRFSEFVEALIDTIQSRKKERNLRDWSAYIDHLTDRFLLMDEEDLQEYTDIIRPANQFEFVDELMENEAISYEVFSKRLSTLLHLEHPGNKYLSRGITFCSPLPFRSIPFKVIAFLGLNFDRFPRKEKKSDFDLIKYKSQPGDRNIRDNDKHLFLESFLSAKDALYLSYIGRSVKDNTSQPPSPVIDELLEYIQYGLGTQDPVDVYKEMVIQYPLHSFSSRYNQEGSRLLPNFFIKKEKDRPVQMEKLKEANVIEAGQVFGLKDVEIFCLNSIAYYYNKVMRIYLYDEDNNLEDTEIFEMDTLQQWLVRDQLLRSRLSGKDLELSLEELYLRGELPLKNMKFRVAAEQNRVVQILFKKLEAVLPGPLLFQSQTVRIALNNQTNIEGDLDLVTGGTLVNFLQGKNESKALIRLYIRYLSGLAAGIIHTAYLISKEVVYRNIPLSREQALERLEAIITTMKKGGKELIFFASDLVIKTDNEADFESKTEKKVTEGHNEYARVALEKGKLKGQFDNYRLMESLIYEAAITTFRKQEFNGEEGSI